MELGPISELIVLFLALIGTIFMLISGLGMIRLPDVFTRMHAAGKASTLGVSSLLLAAGVYFYDEGRLPTMIALILLFFVTGPIATTTMARAAHRAVTQGIKNEDGTQATPDFRLRIDELADSIEQEGREER